MDNVEKALAESVSGNVWGGSFFGLARADFINLPGGPSVPTAIPDHPETKTYWLRIDGGYRQITHEQAFAQQLWLHYAYGDSAPTAESHAVLLTSQGLAEDFHVSDAALLTAVLGLPGLLDHLASDGFGFLDVLAYAHAAAPEIMLVGLPADTAT